MPLYRASGNNNGGRPLSAVFSVVKKGNFPVELFGEYAELRDGKPVGDSVYVERVSAADAKEYLLAGLPIVLGNSLRVGGYKIISGRKYPVFAGHWSHATCFLYGERNSSGAPEFYWQNSHGNIYGGDSGLWFSDKDFDKFVSSAEDYGGLYVLLVRPISKKSGRIVNRRKLWARKE